MYCTKLDIYGLKQYPLLLSAIYEGIAEIYNLPPLEMLMSSIKTDVQWPDRSTHGLQVYYLEDMIEESASHVFEIRFKPAKEAREHVAIFLSLRESSIGNMSIQFPGRSGRGCFSRIFAVVKSASHDLRISNRDLNFEAQGFTECGTSAYIKEHSLSAFAWVEGLNRYIHVKEDPRQIRDVRSGYAQL